MLRGVVRHGPSECLHNWIMRLYRVLYGVKELIDWAMHQTDGVFEKYSDILHNTTYIVNFNITATCISSYDALWYKSIIIVYFANQHANQ